MKLVYKLDTTRTYAPTEYADLVKHAAKHHGIKINHDLFNPTETQITYTLPKIYTLADLFIALAWDTRSIGDMNLNNLYYLPYVIRQLKNAGFNKTETMQCLNQKLTIPFTARIIRAHTHNMDYLYKALLQPVLLKELFNSQYPLPSMVVGSRFFDWVKWRCAITTAVNTPPEQSNAELRDYTSNLGIINQALSYETRYGLITKLPNPKLRHQDMEDLGWLADKSSAWDTSTYPIYTTDYPISYAYRAYPYFLSNYFDGVQNKVANPFSCKHAQQQLESYTIRSIIIYAHKLCHYNCELTSTINHLPNCIVKFLEQTAFSTSLDSMQYKKTEQSRKKYAKIVRWFNTPPFTKVARRNYMCLSDFMRYLLANAVKNTWGSCIKLQPIVNAYNAQARKD